MSKNVHPFRNRVAIDPGFDPRLQPVVPVRQVLQPLLPGTIELAFINSAFHSAVEWQVEPLFVDSFGIDSSNFADVIQAAVFVPLVQRAEGVHVIFTRRASHLYNHGGQICFPGGRIERSDRDAIAAALRETQEEIGVGPEFIQLIGTQPSFLTSTRFTMKPIIGIVRPGFTIKSDATEVAEVFEVPLSVLMDPARHQLHEVCIAGVSHRFYFSISWGSYFIWGATAALIRNFYHYLAAAQLKLDR